MRPSFVNAPTAAHTPTPDGGTDIEVIKTHMGYDDHLTECRLKQKVGILEKKLVCKSVVCWKPAFRPPGGLHWVRVQTAACSIGTVA